MAAEDPSRPDRVIALAVAGLGLLWGTLAALGVGDPDASGIVEESLGGPGTAVVLGLFFIGVPAVAVGVVDGLTVRIRGRALRLGAQVLLVGGFGFWAGLWIYGFTDIDCDGTCIAPDRSIVWATLTVAFAFLAVEVAIATAVRRRARTRRHRPVAPTDPAQ